MAGWIDVARDLIGREGAVVRASLVGVRGSAPREAGAMMLITGTEIWQTIGGGTLEFEVMAGARDLIAAPDAAWRRKVITAALGPDMGQCCGGQVRVLLERFGAAEDATLAALEACRVVAHPLSGDDPLTDGGDAAPGRDGDVFVAPVALPGRPSSSMGPGMSGGRWRRILWRCSSTFTGSISPRTGFRTRSPPGHGASSPPTRR